MKTLIKACWPSNKAGTEARMAWMTWVGYNLWPMLSSISSSTDDDGLFILSLSFTGSSNCSGAVKLKLVTVAIKHTYMCRYTQAFLLGLFRQACVLRLCNPPYIHHAALTYSPLLSTPAGLFCYFVCMLQPYTLGHL